MARPLSILTLLVAFEFTILGSINYTTKVPNLDVATNSITRGAINWMGGNVTYVPLSGDIQTYVNSAIAGDTLVLASGTYMITNTISIAKPLNVVGQGYSGFSTTPVTPLHGTIIKSTNANVTAFQLNTNNIRIASLSLNMTGANSTGINTTTNLVGIAMHNIDVLLVGSGVQQGFRVYGSDAILRNLTFDVISTDETAMGVQALNDAFCTNNNVIDAFNVTGTVVATNATPFHYAVCYDIYNGNVAKTITLNLDNSVCRAFPGTPNDIAVWVQSTGTANAICNAYLCTFSGADYDASVDAGNVLALGGSVLVNKLVSGTPTYRATMASGAITLNGADLETQLTNKVLKAGDTVSGAILTTSASTNSPATNEFVTARYVATSTASYVATNSANWVASGTTDSGLAGLASVGRITATNGTIHQFKTAFSTNYVIGTATNQQFFLLNGTNQLITLPAAAGVRGIIYRFSMTNGWGSCIITNSGDGAKIRDGTSLSYTNIGINEVGFMSDGAAWWLASKGKTIFPAASWSLNANITPVQDVITNLPFDQLEFNNSQGIALKTNALFAKPTQLWITNSGTYLITFSAVLKGSAGGSKLSIWLRKDGSDVARTRTDQGFSGATAQQCMTVNYFVAVGAPCFYELVAASHDASPPTIEYGAANPTGYTAPAMPAVIVTINRVSDTWP